MPILDEFIRLPVTGVLVDRDRRQRRAVETGDLLDSVRLNGVLQPIIVRPRGDGWVLVAGERRLEASRQLGLATIPARLASDLTPTEAQIFELEENIKRSDLEWQDLVSAVGTIHELYCRQDPDWTLGQTANACSLTTSTISIYLKVWAELDDPRIVGASTAREAYNILGRREQRLAGEALQELLDTTTEMLDASMPGGPTAVEPTAVPSPIQQLPTGNRRLALPAEDSILHESFLHWAPRYEGRKFNLIHCDFPYGINLFSGPQGGASGADGLAYADSKDIYQALVECLCQNLDRLMQVSAHLVFWYSAKHHDWTLDAFRRLAPSLVFHPYPLVWVKSDNAGIASDAARTPRHVYETALFASRGGRNLVRVAADAYSAPTDRRLHPSAKPEGMLKHFLGMLVDENTRLLDPTCGSGSALRAAEELGAASVLGLEVEEQACGIARQALRQSRTMRQGAKALVASGG